MSPASQLANQHVSQWRNVEPSIQQLNTVRKSSFQRDNHGLCSGKGAEGPAERLAERVMGLIGVVNEMLDDDNSAADSIYAHNLSECV